MSQIKTTFKNMGWLFISQIIASILALFGQYLLPDI